MLTPPCLVEGGTPHIQKLPCVLFQRKATKRGAHRRPRVRLLAGLLRLRVIDRFSFAPAFSSIVVAATAVSDC